MMVRRRDWGAHQKVSYCHRRVIAPAVVSSQLPSAGIHRNRDAVVLTVTLSA